MSMMNAGSFNFVPVKVMKSTEKDQQPGAEKPLTAQYNVDTQALEVVETAGQEVVSSQDHNHVYLAPEVLTGSQCDAKVRHITSIYVARQPGYLYEHCVDFLASKDAVLFGSSKQFRVRSSEKTVTLCRETCSVWESSCTNCSAWDPSPQQRALAPSMPPCKLIYQKFTVGIAKFSIGLGQRVSG